MKIITKKTPLREILELTHPCKCNACTNGCKFGSGTFSDDEIPKLAKHLKLTEDELKKKFLEEIEKFHTCKLRPRILRKDKQYGRCIFFDEKIGCKIHEHKPLECKIAMPCKEYGEELITWFNLNHFLNENDDESIRQYASYLRSNGKTLKGASLQELIPDREKLKKILQYEM
ncbi:YkgJ family cysteine cluster protein [Candidatus Woesearchaeota archaeon]|nr:YkgJ family cysteine cluster protein [Candidatus Woesearchaeota archaeon]